MGMPKLLKAVDKVDDYTIKITLNQPEAPFLSNLAMQYAAIQSKEYAIAMLKAGTPEKLDQEPDRHRAVLPGAVPEGRDHPLQGLPDPTGPARPRSTT
jgi:ABC-type transport system substrate-binding protein